MNTTTAAANKPPRMPDHVAFVDKLGLHMTEEYVWDEDGEFFCHRSELPDMLGSTYLWENDEDMMYDLIGKTPEYRASGAVWEDPACWAALSRTLAESEKIDKGYKLVVKGDEERITLSLMHKRIGPVWGTESLSLEFPITDLELSDTLVELQDELYKVELLTHGCQHCWSYCRFDKAGEIASEYSVRKDLVEDILTAIRNGEFHVTLHGPIEPDCAYCNGLGGVPTDRD